MLSHLNRLYAHLAWADAAVLEGLRRAPDAHAGVRAVFAHVLGAEHVWLQRLRQEPTRVAVWPELALEECAALAGENVEGYRALLAELSDDGLAAEVAYVNSAGDAFRSTVADILLHVALHGAYHRGQVAAAVRAEGGAPVPTDYIAFVRGAPAATRPVADG